MKSVSIISSLFLLTTTLSVLAGSAKVDALLTQKNAKAEQPVAVAEGIDDLTFLRRASVDVIGRIPTPARRMRIADRIQNQRHPRWC